VEYVDTSDPRANGTVQTLVLAELNGRRYEDWDMASLDWNSALRAFVDGPAEGYDDRWIALVYAFTRFTASAVETINELYAARDADAAVA
jgi:hypothetical protein